MIMAEGPIEKAGGAALSAVVAAVPQAWREFFYYWTFAVSAEIPVTVWTVFSPRRRRFTFYFLLSLFFTLVMTGLVSLVSGTFWPDGDPMRLNLLEDRWNLALYALICPAYVAVCILMLGASISYWSKTLPGPGAPVHLASVRNWRFLISLALCLLVASVLVVNYIFDTVFNGPEALYWFLERPSVINKAGFYYVILNYSLLLITAVSIFAYIGTVLSALSEIGQLSITRNTAKDRKALLASIDHINDFWEIMILARILAALYITNTFIWKFSPLGDGTATNLWIAVAIITLIGVIGTLLPKFVANRKFGQLRGAIIALKIDPDEMTKVPSGVNFWGWVANIVGITGFPLAVASLNVDFVYVLETLFKVP